MDYEALVALAIVLRQQDKRVAYWVRKRRCSPMTNSFLKDLCHERAA
jgi:hypothetical protein